MLTRLLALLILTLPGLGVPATGLAGNEGCCPVVELRQYTLLPGKRNTLIELFDREFVESQEAVGMTIIGQFRDLDDSTHFVWLRGFRDMPTRAKALAAFYGGSVWKDHREAARATMVDADNVLLLRPACTAAGFIVLAKARPAVGSHESSGGVIVATIYHLDAGTELQFTSFFERDLKPILEARGASILAYFVSEKSKNTYPALAIREGENVFVWFSRYADQSAYERYVTTTAGIENRALKELTRRIKGKPETLLLSPTARSQLR